jgi:quinol monooxygenase YgiN
VIILAGTVRVAAGKRHAAMTEIERMVHATRAEPGCIAYAFSFDVLDDHLIRIFEVFRDEAALAEHRGSAHMAAWRAALPSLGIGDRDLWHYEVSAARKI